MKASSMSSLAVSTGMGPRPSISHHSPPWARPRRSAARSIRTITVAGTVDRRRRDRVTPPGTRPVPSAATTVSISPSDGRATVPLPIDPVPGGLVGGGHRWVRRWGRRSRVTGVGRIARRAGLRRLDVQETRAAPLFPSSPALPGGPFLRAVAPIVGLGNRHSGGGGGLRHQVTRRTGSRTSHGEETVEGIGVDALLATLAPGRVELGVLIRVEDGEQAGQVALGHARPEAACAFVVDPGPEVTAGVDPPVTGDGIGARFGPDPLALLPELCGGSPAGQIEESGSGSRCLLDGGGDLDPLRGRQRARPERRLDLRLVLYAPGRGDRHRGLSRRRSALAAEPLSCAARPGLAPDADVCAAGRSEGLAIRGQALGSDEQPGHLRSDLALDELGPKGVEDIREIVHDVAQAAAQPRIPLIIDHRRHASKATRRV